MFFSYTCQSLVYPSSSKQTFLSKIEILRTMMYWCKVIAFFSAVLLLLMGGTNNAYSESRSSSTSEYVLMGHVDSLAVEGDKLIASGWAGAAKPKNKVVSIQIWFADKLIYEGPFERFDRPDVAEAMGRSDWLNSGWRINIISPINLSRVKHPIRVQAKLEEGGSAQLVLNSQVVQNFNSGVFHRLADKMWKTRVMLIAIFILLCTVYFQADFFAEWVTKKTGSPIRPPLIFGFTLFLSFWILISLGITGSSLKLGLQQTPFVQSDVANVWGNNQDIRSDEWRVFTPLAIAQYNHHPKFPVVNANLGEDGQNMLIVGMAGTPVAHISAIAKPATWGFFLFDLKRALSWYWCFPIFACLFALWGVIALLISGQWRSSFLIALWFSVSPYVTAWSHWPAYAVFFPSLALITAIAILRSHSKYLISALGGILGVALAGFVLVLYPPWQVSLGYVFLALTVGIVVRDKLYRNFNKIRLASYGIAIIIASFILSQWWLDAHLAIQAMQATVYPGQRISVTGGSVAMPYLLRGFTNLVTLNKLDSTYSNQSEIASFYYMLLPLTLIFVLRIYQKAISAVEIALAVSISFILYFMLVGVPAEVAKFSLWGRVTPGRADIAFGLSNIILCGVLLSPDTKYLSNRMLIRILAFVVALIWTTLAFNSIFHLHESILSGFSPGVLVGLFLVVIASGYWLTLGKFREFIYLNLALSVATIWPFNPINIAPHSITFTSNINKLDEKKSNPGTRQQILVLETQVPAMYLLASGFPVTNGVFYYPQSSLWARLDKNKAESNTYNRYQHMIFSGGVVENNDHFRIESPYPDQVKVVVDLVRFDFRKTGAELIIAPLHEESLLRKNAVLTYIKNDKGWSWFQIKGEINAN